jgi:cysteine-rich repeat protein
LKFSRRILACIAVLVAAVILAPSEASAHTTQICVKDVGPVTTFYAGSYHSPSEGPSPVGQIIIDGFGYPFSGFILPGALPAGVTCAQATNITPSSPAPAVVHYQTFTSSFAGGPHTITFDNSTAVQAPWGNFLPMTFGGGACADADFDGICNDTDSCPLDAANDGDGDGICANLDNCPLTANPSQTDANGNGQGDVCEGQVCGNGLKTGTEMCDDGNIAGGDGCSAICTLEITAPPPPPFSFDKPLPDADARVCLPPFMVQNTQATHLWWARATGGRPLEVQLIGIGVNPSESGLLVMKVYDPSNTQVGSSVLVNQPGAGENAATPHVITGTASGQLYRIEVSMQTPVPMQPARHYRLVLQGASLLGTNSSLQAQVEGSNVRWGINAAGGENFTLNVAGGPEAPITTGTVGLRNPAGTLIASGAIPGTLSISGATAGHWLASITGADHHYVLDKTNGADRGLYVNWMTWGNEAAISGTITRGGSPNGVPVNVQVVNTLTGQVQTIAGVTGSFSANKLLPGSYTVTVGSQSQSVSINCDGTATANFDLPKLVPLVTVTGGTFTYDGNTHTATAQATGAGNAIVNGSFTITYAPGGTDPVNAGPYTATASFTSSDSNYTDATGTGSITIDPATPTVTVTGGTFTYDGLPHPATGTATGVGGATVAGTFAFAYVSPIIVNPGDHPIDAGEFKATGTFTSTDPNYNNGASFDAMVTINPATPTVTVTGGTFTYDGVSHGASATVAGVGGAAVTGSFAFSYAPGGGAPVNAGGYTATASFTSTDSNYTNATGTGSITINPATPTVTVTGGTFTYNALTHPASAVATGVGGENVTGSFSFSYAPGGTAPVNVGSYVATASLTSTNPNYTDAAGTGSITINQSNTTTSLVTSSAFSIVGTPVTFTASVVAVVPGGGIPDGTVTFYDGATAIGTVSVDGSGVAVLSTSLLALGPHSVTATYNGSSNFIVSASAPVSVLVYALTSATGGGFVIGDLNAVVGKSITFWGAQWEKLNSMSGGPANASFKGFANRSTTNPATAGGSWTTDPGNSSNPPAGVSSYIAVIVTSQVTKSGSTISGNIPRVAIVKTNAGYSPNPGHAGTGTVVAILP